MRKIIMFLTCVCVVLIAAVSGQRALYNVCDHSDECSDGLFCGTPNITGPTPLHLRVHAPTDKICLCDIENGWVEKEHSCSDADILKTSVFAILIVSCIRKVLAF